VTICQQKSSRRREHLHVATCSRAAGFQASSHMSQGPRRRRCQLWPAVVAVAVRSGRWRRFHDRPQSVQAVRIWSEHWVRARGRPAYLIAFVGHVHQIRRSIEGYRPPAQPREEIKPKRGAREQRAEIRPPVEDSDAQRSGAARNEFALSSAMQRDPASRTFLDGVRQANGKTREHGRCSLLSSGSPSDGFGRS